MSLTCDSVRRNLSLFLYGELKIDEEERTQAHLEICEQCRVALEQASAVHHALDLAETPIPDGLLVSARRGLRQQIAAKAEAAAEAGPWARISNWFSGPGMIWKPAGAVALAALAFYGGRASSGSGEVAMGREPVASATSVRYVEPDPSGSGVRISLDETRQRTVRGSLEDPVIRQLLFSAAKSSDDPGLRAETVEVLCQRSTEGDIRDALLYTLEHDSNAAVRLKALDGLKQFSKDKNTRDVLKRVLLKDSNSNVRAMAIDVLTKTPSQDMVGPLQELMRKEDNDYVRMRTQTILSEMNASPGIF